MPDGGREQDVLGHPLAQLFGEQILSALDLLDGSQIPEPYRGLLVHNDDMTGTLERYHGQPMKLRVLDKFVTGREVTRQVELIGERDENVAEFGAIRIQLGRFGGEARRLVVEGRRPLGGILTSHGIEFVSRPRDYFRIKPGSTIRQSLSAPRDGWLYGRRNQLLTPAGEVIADVIEVLPPGLEV